MKKYLKILLTLFFIFTVVCTATIYFVTQKIEPETLKRMVITTVEKNFPESRLIIGAVEYELGREIIFSLNGLKLKTKKNESSLLALEQLTVHLPIWAILLNGGTIDIKSNNLSLYYKEQDGIPNWSQILAKTNKVNSKKNHKQNVNVEIPSYFRNSKLNLKLKNSKILFTKDGDSSKLDIDKVYFKNINLKDSTVVTLTSRVEYNLNSGETFKTYIESISEINFQKLIEERILKIASNIKLKKTAFTALSKKVPEVRIKLSIQGLLEDFIVSLNLKANRLIDLESKINKKNNKVIFKDLLVVLSPQTLLSMSKHKISESMELENFDKEKVTVKGDLSYDLSKKAFHGNIKTFNNAVTQVVLKDSKVSIKPRFDMKLIDQDIKFSLMSELLKGKIDIKAKSNLDLKKIDASIDLSEMELTRKELRGLIYKDLKSPKSSPGEIQQVKKDFSLNFPHVNILISGRNNDLDQQNISFKASVNLNQNIIRTSHFELQANGGSIEGSNTNVFKEKYIDSKLNVSFVNAEAETFRGFLPTYFESLKGSINGSVIGGLEISNELQYSLDSNLKVWKGEFKNLNLMKFLKPMLSSVKLLKNKLPKNYNFSDKFDELSMRASSTEKNNVFEKFVTITGNNQFKIEAKGNVSMLQKSSEMKGTLTQKSKKTEIPFILKGEGFGLKPILKYTTDKMATKLYRTEKKKTEKKIKKGIDKAKKDLKKKLEDELKKKFKGFKL